MLVWITVPKFYYQALDSAGVKVNGRVDAADAWLARKAVTKQGLKVTDVTRLTPQVLFDEIMKYLRSYQGPVTLEDLLMFISQMETGLSVGIPLLQLLEMVQTDLKNLRLKSAVNEIANDVAQGALLHKSFEKHPRIFDSTFVGLIRAGELSGNLDKVLSMLFRLTEQRSENRTRIKSAMFYPKIVIGFMVVVVLVIVYFVIPKLKVFLTSFGTDLPPITKVVVAVSDFFLSYWYLVGSVAAGIYYAFKRYESSPQGRATLDGLKLKMPLMGEIFSQIELISFCSVLELLLESGISITEALDTLKQSQTNSLFRNQLDEIQTKVTSGNSLRSAMGEAPVFPSTLVSVIGIGEESGRIPDILKRMGRHYQLKVDFNLGRVSKMIEPLLLVVIFALTLVLALAVFLPIWKMSSAVRAGNH